MWKCFSQTRCVCQHLAFLFLKIFGYLEYMWTCLWHRVDEQLFLKRNCSNRSKKSNNVKFLKRKFSHLQKDKNGFVYPRIVEGSLYIKVIFLQENAYLSIRIKAFTKNWVDNVWCLYLLRKHVGKYSSTVYFIVSTVWWHNYVYVINCNLCFHFYLLEYRHFFFIFHGFIHSS